MSDLVFSVGVDTAEAVKGINDYFDAVQNGAKNASKFLQSALGEAETELEVEISFKNGEVVARQIEKIGTNTAKTEKAQKAVNGEIGKSVRAVRQQLNTVKKLRDGIDRYQKGTKKATKDWEQLNNRAKDLQRTLTQMTSSGNWFQRMADSIGRLGGQMLAANLASKAIQGSFNALTGAIQGTIGAGMEMEQLSLQLKGFTGSAEAADQAMKDFIDIAVKTPMNLMQVAKAGKTLMGFGIEADKAKEATYRLAVIAGATGGELNNLARNFGQIGTQGRAYTRDLQQFAIQGIPIWTELSKVVGKTTQEVKKMAEDGSIGLKEVEQALDNMTASGTAFDVIAQEMQNTWQGQIEAMVSALQVFSGELVKGATQVDNAFGKPVQNTIKTIAAAFIGLADNMKVVIKVVGTLTGFLVGLTAALAVNVISQYIYALGGLISVFQMMGQTIMQVVRAQTLLNALSGPKGWVALGVGLGVATAAFVAIDAQMKKSGDTIGTVQDRLKDLHQKMGSGAPSRYGTAVLALEGNIAKLSEEHKNLTETQKMYQNAGIKTNEIDKKREETARKLLEAKRDLKALTENSGMPKEVKEAEDLLLAQNRLYESTAKLKKQKEVERDETKKQLDEEKGRLDGLMDRYKQLSERKKEDIRAEIEVKKEAISAEKDALKTLLDDYKQGHETRMDQIKSEYDGKIEVIDAELDALGQRTKSEEKLRIIKRKQIQDKLKSKDLSYEERLELQAQLERMEAQDKRQALMIQKKRLQKEKTQELTNQENKYEKAVDQAKKASEDKVDVLEEAIDAQETLIKVIEDSEKALTRSIEDATVSLEARGQSMEELEGQLRDQIAKVDSLNTSHQNINKEVEAYATKMENIKNDATETTRELQKQLKLVQAMNQKEQPKNTADSWNTLSGAPEKGPGWSYSGDNNVNDFYFSGGPMQKGQTSWVNELGKEAFLTASGKLSMINSGPFSQWTAPESGTVIPAHLTKQLDIPTGGVDLSKPNTTGLANSVATGKGLGSVIKAIKQSAGGGGQTTNNVTVQAANPTQTASDMTVALNRARHSRYT